jgi:CRISPR/Cas system CMR subunit Cmr4 (Cas7 group RAMP superfamily)
MFTNADMTLYSCGKDGKFTRKEIRKVFWEEVKQSLIEKTGLSSSDAVKVFIPAASAPDGLDFTTSKDLVIKGIVATEFDNTSPQTIAASLTAIKAAHDVYTVTVADGKLYGSPVMQHYQISCR